MIKGSHWLGVLHGRSKLHDKWYYSRRFPICGDPPPCFEEEKNGFCPMHRALQQNVQPSDCRDIVVTSATANTICHAFAGLAMGANDLRARCDTELSCAVEDVNYWMRPFVLTPNMIKV